ncbi:MAG TPA: glycosyltransferase [Candidatus Aquilonibacter sp.]
MNRRHALVVGFDYFGRLLSKLVNEYSSSWQLHFRGTGRIHTALSLIDGCNVDAIISFGGPGPNTALAEIARRRNLPVIVIWAGTDVITSGANPHLLEVIKNYQFTNISVAPWLIDELRELGVAASYVPVAAIEPAQPIAPLPAQFKVLTYLPEPRRPFYGERTVYDIAAQFPEIPFTVVGRGDPNRAAPRNVTFRGYVSDMSACIDDCSVLVRLPRHDGLSNLVLEALARGRHVIWNHDFPGVCYAKDTAQAISALSDLLHSHRAGLLQPNECGYHHVAQNYGRAQLAAGFEAVLERALRDRPVRHPERRRVAISGLDLFTAQVVRELESRPSTWSACPLQMRSRLEVASSMLSLATSDIWYSIGAPIGNRRVHLLAGLLSKPRVIHWVGSDILALRNSPGLRRSCRNRHVLNLAEAQWTIDELRVLGIEALLAPLPPRLTPANIAPLPNDFTILFYIPKTRGEFYGRREYERLIRTFANCNVRFFVVGGGECYAPPGTNITRFGWQTSLENIYEQTTVLVRFTEHDGLSLMTLEALAHGRHVLWTQSFPFVTRVQDYAQLEAALRALLASHERGELRVQHEAAGYIEHTYSPERCIETIAAAWDRAAS